MLHRRLTVLAAFICALINAGGLGVGLLSLGPLLKLVLDEQGGRSLRQLALEHNDGHPLVAIPVSLIELLPEDRYRGVLFIIVGILGLTVVGGIANFLHQYLSQTLATRTVARIRAEAFRTAVHLPLGRVVERGPSEFMARLVRDAGELQRGLIALTSKAVAQVAQGAAALIAAFWFNWVLAGTALVVAPALAIVLRRIGTRIRRGTRGSLQAQEHMLRVAGESLQGLRAVKAATGERAAIGRFHRANRDVVRHELKVRTARSLSGPLIEIITTFAICGLALVAAKQIIDGHLSFESFISALVALGVAAASFRPLTGLITEVQSATAPAERLVQIMDEPMEDPGRARPRLPRHARSIEFQNVSFSYRGSEGLALDRVSLNILHGERIAIVGPNGSGKTTLVSLLPRLLDPCDGRVRIDGIDVATVNLRSLRRQVGVVTQEIVLFRGSIAANIAFGMPSVTTQEIIDAARRAHAAEFIDRLPRNYDTDVLEQGAALSGGQRQRLAIARAILRDPSILILDEATSQVDAESEAQIAAALADFCRGRTSLIIAHRLSTVMDADRIVVMDAGRIDDQGTHQQLLARCELYARLTRTQLVER